MGAGDGIGATLNVPLPFGVGDQGYAQVFTELIIPAVQRWKPQMILVSAGYDGHWNDPLGPMALSVTGYAQLTRMIYDLAGELCDGRLLLVLEGGYNLEALGACVVAALQVLLGRDPGPDPIGIDSGPGTSVNSSITALRRLHPLLAEQ
jgi:acetoin utilization deacetylase AcuC-like enzyme